MTPTNNPAHAYQSVQNAATTPEDTLVTLLQGTVRVLQDGQRHLSAENYEQWHDCSTRVRRVLSELLLALDDDHAPELNEGLRAMYVYIQRLITEAGLEEDFDKLQEAIDLLGQLADTWKEALDECNRTQEKAA
jgi:flagellar protein FliS